jgi:hypothetical protein
MSISFPNGKAIEQPSEGAFVHGKVSASIFIGPSELVFFEPLVVEPKT